MESPPLSGNLSFVQDKLIDKLVMGRGFAAQLQIVLHEQRTGSGHGSTTAEDLVTKILRSFTEALSILSSSESSKVNRHPRTAPESSLSKRRKMQETWTRITAMPIEDGYVWRKYGRKEIHNAKYIRSYFRCTYRFDQGCYATKQVQRTEDEPPSFCTKYVGHHTCQYVLKASSSFSMDSTADEEVGLLLSFKSDTEIKQQDPFFSAYFPTSKEEEHKKESFPSSIEQEYINNQSSSIYLPPLDLTKFESSIHTSVLPSTSHHSVHGDVVSGCTTSSFSSFHMDMDLMDFVYLNDVFYDEELF